MDLKILFITVDGEGIGGIGLQFYRIGAALFGHGQRLQGAFNAAIMVGGEFGNDVGGRLRSDRTTGDSNLFCIHGFQR